MAGGFYGSVGAWPSGFRMSFRDVFERFVEVFMEFMTVFVVFRGFMVFVEWG